MLTYPLQQGKWDPKCKMGTQFPPLAPGLFGFGATELGLAESEGLSLHLAESGLSLPEWYRLTSTPQKRGITFNFSIVDQLKVPSHLTPGDYVLSFRWDCEETPQIWAQCSNIKIV